MKKQKCIILAVCSFLGIGFISGLTFLGNEKFTITSANKTYSITLDKNSKLDYNKLTVKTMDDNEISFLLSDFYDCKEGFVELQRYGSITNPFDVNGHHNKISGLESIKIKFTGDPLQVEYGWEKEAMDRDFTAIFDYTDSEFLYNFNNNYPSYFNIYEPTGSSMIEYITINYSCFSSEPNFEETGLEFKLNSDGESYNLINIDSKFENIVIPKTYRNKPVKCVDIVNDVNLDWVFVPQGVDFGFNRGLNCDKYLFGGAKEEYSYGTYSSYYNCKCPPIMDDEMYEYIIINDPVEDYAIITAYKGAKTCITVPGNVEYLNKNYKVKKIGESVFKYNDILTDVVLSENIEETAKNAFYGCSKLANLKLPNSLKNIDNGAFSECSVLNDVIIPMNVDFIHEYAFSGDNKATLLCERETPFLNSERQLADESDVPVVFGYKGEKGDLENGLHYAVSEINGVKNVVICRLFNENATEIHIPSQINEIPVTKLANGSFIYNRVINKLFIPKTVDTIETYSFFFVSNLDLYLEADCEGAHFASSWNSACPAVFGYINVNGVLPGNINYALGSYKGTPSTFILHSYDADSEEVIIPSSVDYKGLSYPVYSIGAAAFNENKIMRKLTIEEGLKVIDAAAFYGCSALSEVKLPSTLKKIEFSGMERCEKLTKIDLPDGIEYIGNSAFYNCALTDIFVPASLIYIGNSAFYNPQLKEIKCGASSQPETWNENWTDFKTPIVWNATRPLA